MPHRGGAKLGGEIFRNAMHLTKCYLYILGDSVPHVMIELMRELPKRVLGTGREQLILS